MVSSAPVVRRVTLLGPAFIAAVAYVDPGNVATNVTAGSRFGYTLVWVVVMANVMAVLVFGDVEIDLTAVTQEFAVTAENLEARNEHTKDLREIVFAS